MRRPAFPLRRGEPTAEQAWAVDIRASSVVLSSGAGCGKTEVLMNRYLSHLRVDGADVRQIAAITFTDRAARQMRDRIRQAVTREVRQAPSDAEAARWADQLRGLQGAQICTIHSFCAALLRHHAIVAGLDPHFEVLEEVLADNLRADALDAALQNLLTAKERAGDDLRALVLLYGWKPVTAAVDHLLRANGEAAWNAWLERPSNEIASEWAGRHRDALRTDFVDYLLAASPKLVGSLTVLRKADPVSPRLRAAIDQILGETPRLGTVRDLAEAVDRLKETAKVGKERDKAWRTPEEYQAVMAAFEVYRTELRSNLALFLDEPDGLDEAAATGQRFLRVAREAVFAYRRAKQRAAALDFQDLLVLARNLLRDHRDLREGVRQRYRYLLIDELQDTDPVQMELVAYLCGDGLTDGKLFAVGDHKQSIYRFRGADVGQFQALRGRVPAGGRLGLSRNFRSQPEILTFTNALFSLRLRDYEPLTPNRAQVNPGPCVEFLWTVRPATAHATEARAAEADCLARRLAAMVNGEALAAEADGTALRSVRQGDIVLLFRSMSNVALYETALRRHGLDYYLVGGRAFYAQQEIYDLLNLLRALENPLDAVCLAGTLRSPFASLSDEALYFLAHHPDGLWSGLHDPQVLERLPQEQRTRARQARDGLDRWRGLKDRLSIARLLGEVLADTAYDAALQFEPLGERKLANLWKLLDMARTFDRSGQFGLAEFIARLGDLVRSQPREEQAATLPEKADVIRLMSIHQAKGLEFPVVVVPDLAARLGGSHLPVAHWDATLGCVVGQPADEDPPPFSDFARRLWRKREDVEEWHEDLRTLYVACTRAEDYLILSASLPRSLEPSNTWTVTLAERFDLKSGECLATDVPSDRQPKICIGQADATVVAARRPRAMRQALPPVEPGAATGWPSDVLPVVARLPRGRWQPITTLDDLSGLDGQSDCLSMRPEFLARQHGAEDGSDRDTWPSGAEHLYGTTSVGDTDAKLRRILRHWDFSRPDAWRDALEHARVQYPGDPGLDKALHTRLERFARSDCLRELASNAQIVRKEVEFVWRSGLEGASALAGVIDCLWCDRAGDWHVLQFDAKLEAPSASLAAACLALGKAVNKPLASATVYRLSDGKSARWTNDQLRLPVANGAGSASEL